MTKRKIWIRYLKTTKFVSSANALQNVINKSSVSSLFDFWDHRHNQTKRAKSWYSGTVKAHIHLRHQDPVCRYKLLGTGISSTTHWWQLWDIYNLKTMQIELSLYKTLMSSMFCWKCHKTFIKVQNIPKKTALSLTRRSEICSLDQTVWRGREMSSVIIIRIR